MKIAVFGGTGQTGQAFVSQALSAGHEVRALARTPEKLAPQPEQLEVIRGDVMSADDVLQTLEGCDAVVCAIGGDGLSDSTTRTRVTQHIIDAMRQAEIKRLVVCSVLGIGGSRKHSRMIGKLVLNTILKNPKRDHEAQEELVYQSGLDWVIIRPPQLVNGPLSDAYRLASESDPNFTGTQVTRADVAHCMMRALQEEDWSRQAWSISS